MDQGWSNLARKRKKHTVSFVLLYVTWPFLEYSPFFELCIVVNHSGQIHIKESHTNTLTFQFASIICHLSGPFHAGQTESLKQLSATAATLLCWSSINVMLKSCKFKLIFFFYYCKHYTTLQYNNYNTYTTNETLPTLMTIQYLDDLQYSVFYLQYGTLITLKLCNNYNPYKLQYDILLMLMHERLTIYPNCNIIF